MIALGLSAADLKQFHIALASNHSIKVTVQVLDVNHQYLSDLSPVLVDGQVNIDADGTPTRSATVTVLDPRRSLGFDSNSPTDGALYLDRMIRIVYSVNAENLTKWIDVPIFCGPVVKINRTDDLLTIEAGGKETLLIGMMWNSWVRQKGHTKAGMLNDLCNEPQVGETKKSFDSVGSQKTTKPFSLVRESIIWSAMKSICGPLGAVNQLYYDGRGYLRFRATPRTSIFTFASGTGGTLTSYPQITFDADSIRNTVLIKGAPAKGSTKPIEYARGAASSLPYSAKSLGRNGGYRYLVDVIEDDTIKTKTQALDIADARLKTLQIESVDVAFDALVIPHLEPEDIATVKTDDFSLAIRIKQMSIPLVVGNTMSVGYTKRVTTSKTKIRRKR